MSQENVDIVRRALEVSTRRDDEATFALYDPEVEIHGQVDGDTYRGLTGVRMYFQDWFAAWHDFSIDAEEWIDAGEDVVVALHVRARGRQSGVPVDQRTRTCCRNRTDWRPSGSRRCSLVSASLATWPQSRL